MNAVLHILWQIVKWLLYILGGLLALLLIILLLVQFPGVQTWITGKVTDHFAEQWNTEVRIGRVNISFLETASLEDIYIEDQAGDTLLYARRLKADVGAFALAAQSLVLDEILLEEAYIRLYRPADSADFNYQFIVDSFVQPDTAVDTTSSSFSFDLHQVKLENVRLRMQDDSAQTDLLVGLPQLELGINTLGLEESHMQVDELLVDGLSGYYRMPAATNVPADTAEVPAQPLDSAWLNPSGFRYTLSRLDLQNSAFAYQADTTYLPGQLNFENLAFEGLELRLEDFYLGSDTLQFSLEQLAAREKLSGFRLQEAAAELDLRGSELAAELHRFVTPNTRLEQGIRLSGLSLDPQLSVEEMLARFEAEASLEQTVLGMRDLLYFMPSLDTLPRFAQLQLQLDLKLKAAEGEAEIETFKLNAEDRLQVRAHGSVQNYAQTDRLRYNVVIEELRTTAAYLQSLAPASSLPPEINKAGPIYLTAQAQGSLENSELVARLNTGPGRVQTRLRYTAPRPNNYLLAGSLAVSNFNLRPFAGDSSGLGQITLNSNFRLRGLGDALNVDRFSLLVDSVDFNQYSYKDLAVEGHFIDSVLELASAYEDPFLAFNMGLKSDLKDSLPLLDTQGQIAHANLLRLGLSPDSLALSTQFTAQVRGYTPDDIIGTFEMRETEFVRGARGYSMDSLIVTAGRQPDGKREIQLVSDHIRADLTGRYLFTELPQAIDQCANYYCSAYQVAKQKKLSDQEITLNLEVLDEPAILKAFAPEFKITYPLELSAEFKNAEQSFSLDLNAPGLIYDTLEVQNFQAKARTEDQVLSFELSSGLLRAGRSIDLPSLDLAGRWEEDSLYFDLEMAPPSDSSHLMLAGGLRFYNDTLGLELMDTRLRVKGREFNLNKDAELRYAPDYLFIRNFSLQNNEQILRAATQEERSAEPKLLVNIDNFQLGDFMDIFGFEEYRVKAELDGALILTQPMNLAAIESDLSVNDISIDSISVGNLEAHLQKVADNGRLTTDVRLQGPNNALQLSGYYNMADSTDAISLDLDIGQFNLAPWDVFARDFVQDLEGSLQGRMEFRGSTEEPEANGRIVFRDDAALRLQMTGAKYRIDPSPLIIESQRIVFNNFSIRDTLDQPLRVDGFIRHQYFTNFYTDLQIEAQNFQLVNKAYTLQEPFYGRLGLNAQLSIQGPVDNVQVDGRLNVSNTTDFTLVMLDAENMAATKEYINFVNTNAFAAFDTAGSADTLGQTIDISGFSMNAQIGIPPDATFRVVVDPNTGDFLEVQGEAEDLRVRIDPFTGMNLQGTYEVEAGRYRLSFMEVVQKNFMIREGSKIDFNGDPFQAQLDITAVYTAEVSRYPLIQAQAESLTTSEISASKRKEPVDVLLTMTGTLEEPTFSFNIIIPESTYTTGSAVQQQLDLIKSDQTRLFRQVFGLIALNRFIPEDPGLGSGGGSAADAVNARINQSLSQFLTEQLSALTEDYLGVELEVELESQQGPSGDTGNRDLTLSLSRSFFSDRIEVKVGGTTGVGGSVSGPGSSGNNFAGNFEVLYYINERGNLSLKIFQRNERNFLTNELYPRAGVAMSYTKSFDELDQIFSSPDSHKDEILQSDGPVPSDR